MAEELKTAAEWAEIAGIMIVDPDGWRMAGAPSWDEPIPKDEFRWRAAMSTVGPIGWGMSRG